MSRWPGRIFHALLRMFPSEFREEYSDEMSMAFLEHDRRERGWRRWRLWIDTLADLGIGASKEHYAMLLHDLRMGFRRLRSQPGFAALAILSLALGVGVNSAIFSVLNETMLRPVPLAEPERIVTVWTRYSGRGGWSAISPADFVDARARARSFEALHLFTHPEQTTLSNGTTFPERISQQSMTPGFLEMLGVRPRAGRFFTEEDAAAGEEAVALISERYWNRKFGSDPAVAGSRIQAGGRTKVIIGVVPESYQFGWISGDADLFTAIHLGPGSN